MMLMLVIVEILEEYSLVIDPGVLVVFPQKQIPVD